MSPRTAAYATALARVAAGAAFVAAPRPVTALWTGAHSGADTPAARVMARGLGVRELLLGAGMVDALRRGGSVRPWSWFAVTAAGLDVAATLAVAGALPPSRRAATPLLAATVLGDAWVAAKLP